MLHPRWILRFWIMGMLSLCDGDDTCHTLLMLDTPEIVGELREEMLANCSTPEDSPDAIFWTIGSTESKHEDEKNFNLLILPLSDWNMTAKCTVKLNETFECSKDLKITVYNIPSMKLSSPYPIIEKNDYELKCHIYNVAPVRSLRVTWYTWNETLHTQTFSDATVTPVNVSSTLNITADRNLHGESFTCKAELDLGPLEPEFLPPPQSLTMTIDVLYPPMIPLCPVEVVAEEHKYSMDMVPCYADGNPAVMVQWYFGGNLINASKPLTRGRSGTYKAVTENGLGRSETSVVVKVEYAPELRDDIEELLVDEGVDVSLSCEAEGSPLFFNWTCDGQNMNVSTSVLNITHVMTTRSCMCVVHNYLGATSKIIRLHVRMPQPPPMPLAVTTFEPAADTGCPLMLMPAEATVRFGDPVTINCTSSAPAILGITWDASTGEATLADVTVATWSLRQMTEWSGEARCILNLGDRLCSKVPIITLYKPPDNVFVRIHDQMEEGGGYLLACDIISVAPVQNLKVKWYYGSEVVQIQTFNQTSAAPVNVSSTFNVTAKREHNGERFRCEAELDLGPNGPQPLPRVAAEAPSPAVLQYKPSFACGRSNEVTENDALQTVCEPDGLPRPVVTWIRDGKEMESSHRCKKNDSGNYLLRATNEHGTADHQLYLDVLYAPLFSKGNSTVRVTPGENVILECVADGNPSPEIQWIFHPAANVVNATGWRRSVLTVSEATSTNAGVYMCVATNKVGRVTRFDTLLMKDQSSTLLPQVFWALLILLAVVLIIGLIVCLMTCKNTRKHRRYSFVPSSSRNDSERSYPLNEVPEWMHT